MKYVIRRYEIKICGFTRREDVLAAAGAGADYAGFVLVPSSRRYVAPERLAELTKNLPAHLRKVGVFADVHQHLRRPFGISDGGAAVQQHIGIFITKRRFQRDHPQQSFFRRNIVVQTETVQPVQHIKCIRIFRIASRSPLVTCYRFRISAVVIQAVRFLNDPDDPIVQLIHIAHTSIIIPVRPSNNKTERQIKIHRVVYRFCPVSACNS